MRNINVWAYHADFGALCRSAGLGDGGGLTYPGGNQQGQAGWHVAVRFQNLHELSMRLVGLPMPREFCGNWFSDCDPIRAGEVVRLAILAHGDQGGKVAVNGRAATNLLTADTVASCHADLHAIGLATRTRGSTIILMGCLAGQGSSGTSLLRALSRVWPGRSVVGFSTVGYRHPGAMKRTGDACELPGMRDTDATAYIFANPPAWDRLWSNFARLPWASDTSPHAKVVCNGVVTRWPSGETPETPAPTPATRGGSTQHQRERWPAGR